ncbi:RILP-like protein homolog [Galendromus occidentalis]|uniref:RILP-like protein homolog n=1 Tax=Galendromus occidentalis TaxID=34638 RepID=A0AAJ6QX16_9ACAR|nr:RILP-like protein homolog [Galendromus occidentalis]
MDHLPALKCSTQEDVYLLSADIGREIEHLVDVFGVDSVKSLVPKLIRVLEFLETAVRQNETLREEADHLLQTVKQLEYDKNEKAVYRKKFEQELEQIEDMWRSEMKDLSCLVTRLQEENTRLSSSLREKTESMIQDESTDGGPGACDSGIFTNGLSQSDIEMLNRLKEAFDRQASQLHTQEKELAQRLQDIESLEHQVERLHKVNADGCAKVRSLEHQVNIVTGEREEIASRLEDIHRERDQLRTQISLERKDKQDELLEAVMRNSPPSLTEYKKVCQDKKELEARVRFLEGELEFYKPPVAKTPSEDSGGEDERIQLEGEEEFPVQGPINKEPDEKLDFSRESTLGIKRFFPKLFWTSRRS